MNTVDIAAINGLSPSGKAPDFDSGINNLC